jgi:hydroxypyruvate reductase
MPTPKAPPRTPVPRYASGKEIAKQIFLEVMKAIDVRPAMRAKLQRHDDTLLAGDLEIPLLRPPCVVAFGKAANQMVLGLHEILGGAVEAGVMVAPAEPAKKIDRFQYFVGGHPYPNAGSMQGARAALELVSTLTPDHTVIFLVSGGGSSLFELPIDPSITLDDLLKFNKALVTGELPIEQINVLRKHLSAVKGGRLATRAFPAHQLTLYISDVPDQYPSMVASGPTMPDESTIEECFALAEKNHLTPKFPASIRRHFEARSLLETPKPGDEHFSRSHYLCLLSNQAAVAAAKTAAEKAGFYCEVDPNVWDADFKEVADANLASLNALKRNHPEHPVALVVGGEVTCPVTGPGAGGRNQAFVLYAAQQIAGKKQVVLSAGTDGRDGNSPASGAVADGQTIPRARDRGFDPAQYAAMSDSYHFFRSLGDTLDTGFTDNNVRDVRLWMDFE